jgi:hypothetical protein
LGEPQSELIFNETGATVEVSRGAHRSWRSLARAAYEDIVPDEEDSPLGLGLQLLMRIPNRRRPPVSLWNARTRGG